MKAFSLLILVSGLAFADDADLLHCRAIPDAGTRLNCYDTLVVRSGTTTETPAAPMVVSVVNRFGLENQRDPAEPDTIITTIPGYFTGWRPNTRILMANGQVWQISDDSSSLLDLENPKVSIRRGMIGAFFLDFEGNNRSPKVRRLK